MTEHKNDAEHVWDMIERVRTTMVITHDARELDGRPLTAFPDRDAGKIYFMTGADSAVVRQLAAEGRVFLTFADKGGHDYVALDGDAIVKQDPAKVAELWNPWAEAFFDGKDDPTIRIVEVTPTHARYWDSPNSVVATVAMLAALATGGKPHVGKEGEATL